MNKLKDWIQTTPYKEYKMAIASSDASFRKYYRLTKEDKSFIVMDSSLELDSLSPFIEISARLYKASVKAPQILEKNRQEGYLILEDFGNTLLLDVLNENNFRKLYTDSINAILKMQDANPDGLPLYDKKFLHFEMDLMKEWYLEKKLSLKLSEQESGMLETTLQNISRIVLQQPQNLFVHRDFHSRNIMLTDKQEIGVIDYQDAMSGALTYDLVSLLKDCYISFERSEIEKLVLLFRDKKGIQIEDALFLKWFDFMGLQRHIKVLGVFSRLHLRDKKDGYLKDIPLTLKYTIETAHRYKETEALATFLEKVST